MDETANTRIICPKCGATVLHEAKFCGMCGSSVGDLKGAPNPYIGQVVAGRYRIDSRIASGGMGEVYVARHETLAQKVAVKLLHRRFASDEQIVHRFFNEARSYCKVKHPYAVSVLDFGRLDDGTLYIVTEFVDGNPLSKTIRESGPMSAGLTVRLARQIGETLAAAHNEQIVHRDLKPDNIMVTAGPGQRFTIKVLDFGIARILDSDETQRLTKTGAIFGTPEYMSPEQAEGRPVTYSTDLYALGCVIFFMLTGKPPFQSKNRTDLLQKQVREPPPLEELRDLDDVPAELVALVESLLEKSADARPDDMLEVLSRLEQLASILPETVLPEASPKQSTQASADGQDAPAEPQEDEAEPELDLAGELLPAAELEEPGGDGSDDDFDFSLDAPNSKGVVADADRESGSDQNDDPFEFDIADGDSIELSDEYSWGDDDDPLAQVLDVDSGEVPASTLSRTLNWLPWVLVPLVLVGLGLAGTFIFNHVEGGQNDDLPELGTGQTAAVADGTGALATLGDAGDDVEPLPIVPDTPPPFPDPVFEIVHAGREAGLAAVLLGRAEVDEAAEAWGRARALLSDDEAFEIDLQVVRDLTRAQELITTATEALERTRCRQADRAIVQMREISPALRRRFLSDLHRCNRQREDRNGRPPRTLGD